MDFQRATAERAAKRDEPYREIVTTDEHGHTVSTQILADWPLERLYRSGAFGRDEELANQRHEAGEKFYALWFHAQMWPLGSRDYRKPYIGASLDPYSVAPTQEWRELQRGRWREAAKVLSPPDGIAYDRVGRVTHYIVIDEKEPVEVGLIVFGRRDKAQARAVAIEFLIEGLDRLRSLWQMRT